MYRRQLPRDVLVTHRHAAAAREQARAGRTIHLQPQLPAQLCSEQWHPVLHGYPGFCGAGGFTARLDGSLQDKVAHKFLA